MDIDSAASTPIVKGTGNPADADYLKYELTAIGYQLVASPTGQAVHRRRIRVRADGPGPDWFLRDW
jgi:hypothetical protein